MFISYEITKFKILNRRFCLKFNLFTQKNYIVSRITMSFVHICKRCLEKVQNMPINAQDPNKNLKEILKFSMTHLHMRHKRGVYLCNECIEKLIIIKDIVSKTQNISTCGGVINNIGLPDGDNSREIEKDFGNLERPSPHKKKFDCSARSSCKKLKRHKSALRIKTVMRRYADAHSLSFESLRDCRMLRKTFPCTFCPNRFSTHNRLQEHLKVHSACDQETRLKRKRRRLHDSPLSIYK